MDKAELIKAIEKAKKNIRYMEKSGQVNTVHHKYLAKFEAELAQLEGKAENKPAKKSRREELING